MRGVLSTLRMSGPKGSMEGLCTWRSLETMNSQNGSTRFPFQDSSPCSIPIQKLNNPIETLVGVESKSSRPGTNEGKRPHQSGRGEMSQEIPKSKSPYVFTDWFRFYRLTTLFRVLTLIMQCWSYPVRASVSSLAKWQDHNRRFLRFS